MKKSTIILAIFICALTLMGCTKNKENLEDALNFKKEYESVNGKSNEYFDYRNVSINEQNPIVYSNADEIIKKMDNKESFYVYFGDNECPWCRSVIETMIEVANKNNIEKIYYVKIWDGFHNEVLRDTYEVDENGKISEAKKGSDAYYELLKKFDHLLNEYTLSYKNKKNKDVTVNVGEKRIFAPNFVYVKNGVADKLIDGISKKQDGYNGELTEEVLEEEKSAFDEFFKNNNTCSADGNC